MDGIASVGNSTPHLQQAVQIDMLKKSNDNNLNTAERLLASAEVAPSAPSNPTGIGQLIDRRA